MGSMDLAAPRHEDLEWRHYVDFTGGNSHFIPFVDLASYLASGQFAPRLTEDLPEGRNTRNLADELCCHRCGQRFGDSQRQMAKHLTVCDAWPEENCKVMHTSCSEATSEIVESSTQEMNTEIFRLEVAALQEMGFDGVSVDTLQALLTAEGSVEKVVTILTAS